MSLTESTFYVTGGTLRHDAPSYVERQADKDLLEGLLKGEFCYVLTSRQMGKSSLMVRTAGKLRERDVQVVVLDLTAIGQNLTPEQWYDGLLVRVGRQLRLEDELEKFWEAHPKLGPCDRFFSALREVVLGSARVPRAVFGVPPNTSGSNESTATSQPRETRIPPGETPSGAGGTPALPSTLHPRPPADLPAAPPLWQAGASAQAGPSTGRLVIFVDELDVVRSLPFSTDEFFAAIRECYNRRTEDPEFNRLTFCLLGVASPGDLIRDTRTTPFNIGRRIELNDFTEAEAAPLAAGLRNAESGVRSAESLLQRVLYWTNGHPYLTQRLCHSIAGDVGVTGPASVDRLCETLFLSARARERDDNLLFVRERLLRSEVDLASLLHVYEDVRAQKRVRDDEANPLIALLRLSGVARGVEGYLWVRNRIYFRAFDREWIRINMPGAEVRRQRTAFWRGVVRATGIAVVMLATLGVLAGIAVRQSRRATSEAKRAEAENLVARRLLYDADMNLAQQALKANNLGRARRLLDRHRPKFGVPALAGPGSNPSRLSTNRLKAELQTDLRGWEWRYLWQECRSDALTMLTKRGQRAFSVSFSPDGRMLAVGYWDGRVELWDVPARRQLRVLFEGGPAIAHVAFSPNSDLLAATAAPGIVKLHHLATGGESILCDLQPARVRDLSFSNDGALLAVLSTMGTVTNSPVLVVNVKDGRLVSSNSVTPRSAGHFNNARFSSDSQRLYLTQGAFALPRLQCVRLPDWQLLWERDGQDTGFSAMALSPDGRFLVTGTGYEFSTIQVWNAQTGEPLNRIEGHTAWVCELVFSRDGRLLASASTDQTLRLWNTITWEEIAVLRGHGDEVEAVAFSADGHLLASGGKDGAVMLWDARAQKLPEARQSLPAAIQFASGLPGGQAFVAQHTNGAWSVIELATFRETRLPISSQDPTALRPPNYLGTYDGTNRFRLYEVAASGLHLLTEKSVGPSSTADFAYFPQRRLLAWREGSQTIQIASLDEEAKRTVLTNDIPLDPLKFRSDGRFLLAVRMPPIPSLRAAVVWDLTTGKEIARSTFRSDQQLTGVLANEGNTLVTFPTNDVVEIRNLLPPDRPPVRIQQQGALYGVAYSPDQRTIAVCSQSGIVVLYDAVKQEKLAILHGHMNAVSSVAFSPDGRRLASTGGGNDAVKLWDVATQQELLTLPGRGTLLSSAEFTDDGNTLLVGKAGTGFFQFWRAPSRAEIEQAERNGPAWPRTEE